MAWANPEQVLLAFLSAAFPAVTVSVVTPKDLEAKLPYIRLTMLGGSDDGFTDTVDIDVECFAATRVAAAAMAEEARTVVLAASATNDPVGTRLVDTVDTVSRPKWVDYRNGKVQRYVATYRLAMRPAAV